MFSVRISERGDAMYLTFWSPSVSKVHKAKVRAFNIPTGDVEVARILHLYWGYDELDNRPREALRRGVVPILLDLINTGHPLAGDCQTELLFWASGRGITAQNEWSDEVEYLIREEV
jgi:hypothetical protein